MFVPLNVVKANSPDMKFYKSIYIIFLVSLLLVSCQDKLLRPAPDVSDIDVTVDLIRYDAGLASINPDKPEASYMQLLGSYPKMTDLYFKELIRIYSPDKTAFYNSISEFRKEPRIASLLDTIKYVFPYNDKEIAENLEQPLKYLKYYFPEKKTPQFYTLMSEFGYQNFIFEGEEGRDAIGIGLDFFLGNKFEYKKIDPGNPVFSKYLSRTYTPEYVAKKAIEMLTVDLLGNPTGKRFIDKMIYQGKKAYIMTQLFPSTPDTLLWEYSQPQMDWVVDNELQIWSFFLEKEMLYETNHIEIANYLEPAPTSKGMPDIAPGRTGVYSGYKIIEAYMDKNPEFTLKDLLAFKDAQRLLEQSKYRPSRR